MVVFARSQVRTHKKQKMFSNFPIPPYDEMKLARFSILLSLKFFSTLWNSPPVEASGAVFFIIKRREPLLAPLYSSFVHLLKNIKSLCIGIVSKDLLKGKKISVSNCKK